MVDDRLRDLHSIRSGRTPHREAGLARAELGGYGRSEERHDAIAFRQHEDISNIRHWSHLLEM